MFVSTLSAKKLLIALVACVFLSFFAGCNEEELAADLYSDAIMLTEANQNDVAIEKLKQSIELNPEFSIAHSMLGDVYQETGDYEKSEIAYEKATELNEYSFHDFFSLGKVREVLEKIAGAAKAYARACELEPGDFDAHFKTAKCYFQLKDEQDDALEEALDYSNQAGEIMPDSGDVQKLIGDIYQAKKENGQAILAYKKALELQGNDPDIMVSLAVMYLRTRQNDYAKEVLDNVLAIDIENNLAYRYLGYYHIRMNEFELALENYLMAISFDETDWNSHKGLGVAYMLRAINNNDSEVKEIAIEHWQISLSINHDQPKLNELLSKYSDREM